MKTVIYHLLIFSIFANYSNRGCAQNNVPDEQIKKKLKDFYIAYNKAWSDTTYDNYILIKKIDSLQLIYCTKKLRNELKNEREKFGFGEYEPLIKDEYTDVKYLNTLTVKQDSTRSNVYIVSYCYPTENASYRPINKKVTIHLLMIKEEGSFKIDSVW